MRRKYINFEDYESVNFGVDQIEDFTLYRDFHNDTLFWDNGKVEILASPEWDGEVGKCAIQIDAYFSISDGFTFDLGHPYDLEKQKQRYLDIIGEVIAKLNSGEFNSFDELLKSVKEIY